MINAQCTAVIIAAAGYGTRLGQGIPKARVMLQGTSVLELACAPVLSSNFASLLVVCLPEKDQELLRLGQHIRQQALLQGIKVELVVGSDTRTQSVHNALKVIDDSYQYVLVHDAARCLTPVEVFHRVIQELADGKKAVIPVMPVYDTLKHVKGNQVHAEVNRNEFKRVQTPQGFLTSLLKNAHTSISDDLSHITDDAMMVTRLGITVNTVPGSEQAMKITTASDMKLANLLVKEDL